MTTYKINLKKLKENYEMFAGFGPVYFPVKTNHNPIILSELKSLGCGFETDSVEHIKKVYSKKIADKILFSNVAKSYDDIVWAIKHKISYYTIDDANTLKTIIDLAVKNKFKKLKFNVRLNVYECFKAEFDKKGSLDSRLGAVVSTASKLIKIINEEKRIEIEKGFSFYIQAEIHNDEDCLIKMLEHVTKSFNKNVGVSFINIGGGADKQRLEHTMPAVEKALKYFGAKYVVLEPGRYMVGNVEDIYIPCIRVVDNIKTNNEVVVSLEMGIYHGLIDILLHKRKFDIFICDNNNLIKLENKNEKSKLVLRGPTADSLDVVGIFDLPKCKIDSNTVFVIKNVGAYVEVFDSVFSGGIKTKFVRG